MVALPPAPFSYGEWRQAAIGGGGFVQDVFLTREPKVRYVTTDAGKTYRLLTGNMPARRGFLGVRGMDADPRNADVVLAACGSHWEAEPEGIMVSKDGGKTWRRAVQATFGGNADERWTGRVIARSPRDPNLVLAGTMGGGMLRSTDAGETWAVVGETERFFTDVKFSKDGRRVWACARPYRGWLNGKDGANLKGGFVVSDDAGTTWREALADSPTEVLEHGATLYGIFRGREIRSSKDGGLSWTPDSDGLRLGNDPGPSETEYNALASGPGFVLTASTEGTFHRRNDGETKWTPLADPKRDDTFRGETWHSAWKGEGSYRKWGKALNSIVVDPMDKDHWFFTDWFALRESRDAGRSWDLRMDGVELTVIHNLAQDPSDPGRLHLGMADNGYLLSRDRGTRWGDGRGGPITSTMRMLAVDPKRPARLIGAGNQGNGQWVSDRVWRSDDAGETWRKLPPPPGEPRINTATPDPGDGRTIYATATGPVPVFMTEDEGRTWTAMTAGLPKMPEMHRELWQIGREIACPVAGRPVLLNIDAGEVFRWNGAAWISSTKAPGGNDIVTDPWGRLYLADGGGLRCSDDGGAAWRLLKAGGARNVAPDMAVKGRLAFAEGSRLWLSKDDGRTWADVTGGLPNRFGLRPAFAGDRLAVGTDGTGVYFLPLTAKAAHRVAARPFVKPPTLVREADLKVVWTGSGKLTLKGGRLAAEGGPAQGSAGAELPGGTVAISGEAVAEGLEEAWWRCRASTRRGSRWGGRT